MHRIEVRIDPSMNTLGLAIGMASDGRKVFIRNGDLLQGDRSVVVVTEDAGNYLVGEIEETYRCVSAIASVLDKDGLVPANVNL